MVKFYFFQGIVTNISDFPTSQNNEGNGCHKIFTVEDHTGSIVHFVIAPSTYFIDHLIVQPGDRVTGFYDGNAPVPLIYPPRYEAIAIAKELPYQNVKADYFNSQLVSSDGTLKLNIASSTQLRLKNDQPFTGTLMNRNLIVLYGASTKSIPALTTPYKIIVWC
ncbi:MULTISPECIES: hypothetical protein [Bacillaceae]|uniref:hypothetical protein n=1 Tax=Bacillaceae TaxID=186817 RepID=UPI001E50B45C|nr:MULTISPECIES: hypothetical protein [Bacillaceae]MCE4050746.1 hypothetical protein [Bacillus sp. Au-Bac7]UPO89845.1 hypothetical protein L8T27_023930 [Niallia sp. Man26]